MSIIRITEDDLELFTVVTNPKKTFSSSSSGVTGAINLFARRSDMEKESVALSNFIDRKFSSNNFEESLRQVKFVYLNSSNIENQISSYLDLVNQQAQSDRKNKQINIVRFEPSVTFSANTLKKNTIREILYPYYRTSHPNNHWAYTNYHSLNFFTASGLPTDSVLLFPNSGSEVANSSAASGSYVPEGAFTFEFYIKPTFKQDEEALDYKAGTVFHMSSTYAISLVSGTLKDSNGLIDGYKIRLQLSHSADISPSLATPGAYPNDLIFETQDNALRYNHWHHVAIRWGTNSINQGSGSIFVDGVENSTFVMPSGTIAPAEMTNNPTVLCVGNFYEGNNTGTSAQELFFGNVAATRYGLVDLESGVSGLSEPANYAFNHILNAELHDLRIYNTFRTKENIEADLSQGPDNLDDMLFYLPPFFTKEGTTRKSVSGEGGVLQTPFFEIDSSTDDPFNVAMSFGVGGHLLNVENFLREFVNGWYPRQMSISASAASPLSTPTTANDILYATSSIRRTNIFLLPCDNGKFIPNYNLLLSGAFEYQPTSASHMEKFVNDLGNLDLSYISLNSLVPTASLFDGVIVESGSVFDGVAGSTPENPGVDPGEVLTIFQRTKDNTSNEVSFFEISNIFYGNRINPGSFSITDSDISGSGGKLSITLKDDSYGNLYRADAFTEHATWNSVGNIFYNEGIVVVKTPNIPFFGKDQFSTTFEGEQTIHVLKVSAQAVAGMVNSSSNPNYKILSASFNANEPNGEFVYITNIDWLDDNLNVVMKTNLAQPIKKRDADKLLLKAKIDF